MDVYSFAFWIIGVTELLKGNQGRGFQIKSSGFRRRGWKREGEEGHRVGLGCDGAEKMQNMDSDETHPIGQTKQGDNINRIQIQSLMIERFTCSNHSALYFIVWMREKHNTGRTSPDPSKNNSLNTLRQQLKNKLI